MARYAFYTSSSETWTAMLREIERARHSVFIEMYIMLDDTPGFDFVETLRRKSRAGVAVKLVLDSFGSYSLGAAAVGSLRADGVEVLFFSRWLHRLHRKLLVVDEAVAITGGVNIHGSAHGWADLALKLTGRRALKTALHLFAKTYDRAGGIDSRVIRYRKIPVARRLKNAFREYGPRDTKQTLKRFYSEKIAGARQSVRLVTPYFVPDRWLVTVLDAAALRGVSVEVIIPETCDSWFMDRANFFSSLKMSKTNVSIYLFPKMNHAKVLLVDDREALVGSQNLDSLSFNVNSESAVQVSDQAMVADIAGILSGWKQQSRLFVPGAVVRRWYDRALAAIVRIFQPFL